MTTLLSDPYQDVDAPDPTSPIVALRAISKTYGDGDIEVRALDHVDLTVQRGEYVSIMGRSGSGKSTLMNILGCLDIASGSTYLLDGEDVDDLDEHDLALIRNRRIGFVFQQFNLLPGLNAWRNVELPLSYGGVPRVERKERAIEALTRVGLADRVDHRPGQLSGGQQQRVAVARALVTRPALVLADEPTGNLDSSATEDVLGLFDELHEQGATIVMITHEPDVAARAARSVHIADGRVQDEASA